MTMHGASKKLRPNAFLTSASSSFIGSGILTNAARDELLTRDEAGTAHPSGMKKRGAPLPATIPTKIDRRYQ
jgi:hypothetical protein